MAGDMAAPEVALAPAGSLTPLAARGESRPGSHALRSSAPHAIAQVDCSGAETSRLKEFEIPSYGGSECRLSAADDHRVEKQVTFVDEIGFKRKSCQLGAANEDVVLRFALELPSRLGIELPLDTRDACPSACQRSREDDLLGLLPDPCEVTVFGRIALHRRIPVRHRLIESPPKEMGSDRSHQLSDEIEYLIGIAPIEGAGAVLDVTVE